MSRDAGWFSWGARPDPRSEIRPARSVRGSTAAIAYLPILESDSLIGRALEFSLDNARDAAA